MLNIYTIIRTDPIGYDEAAGFVVAAADTDSARLLVALHAGDEGKEAWMSINTLVSLIGTTTADSMGEHVIMRDFLAG